MLDLDVDLGLVPQQRCDPNIESTEWNQDVRREEIIITSSHDEIMSNDD